MATVEFGLLETVISCHQDCWKMSKGGSTMQLVEELQAIHNWKAIIEQQESRLDLLHNLQCLKTIGHKQWLKDRLFLDDLQKELSDIRAVLDDENRLYG